MPYATGGSQRAASHRAAALFARDARADPVCRCRLLATPDIEAAVRVGDVYALLTEWHFSKQEFEQALRMIQGMQKRYYAECAYARH